MLLSEMATWAPFERVHVVSGLPEVTSMECLEIWMTSAMATWAPSESFTSSLDFPATTSAEHLDILDDERHVMSYSLVGKGTTNWRITTVSPPSTLTGANNDIDHSGSLIWWIFLSATLTRIRVFVDTVDATCNHWLWIELHVSFYIFILVCDGCRIS